jgi:hypothetical protein
VAVPFQYPHSCSTIFKNTSGSALYTQCFGSDVNFREGEVIAVLGDPFICPGSPQSWDAKDSIRETAMLVTSGSLEVLSRQQDPDLSIRFFYEAAVPSGTPGEDDYSDGVDESEGLLPAGDPRIGTMRPQYRIYVV